MAAVERQLVGLRAHLGPRVEPAPSGSDVVQVRVEELLAGQSLHPELVAAVESALRGYGVGIVFLFPTAERLLRERLPLLLAAIDGVTGLANLITSDIVVAYQGEHIDELAVLAEHGAVVHINNQVELRGNHGTVVDAKAAGKTENILKSLSRLVAEGRDPQRTCVITVDDDYILNDPLNQVLLAVVWLLGRDRNGTWRHTTGIGGRLDGVEFVKSGSPRVILAEDLVGEVLAGGRRPLSFADLLRWLAARSTSTEVNLSALHGIVTPGTLGTALPLETMKELSKTAHRWVRPGGRTVDFLADLFVYRPERPLYSTLSAFTFPLHGDQGCSLESWSSMSLGAGYRLEVSWLVQAVLDERFANTCTANVIATPHAHIPKELGANKDMASEIVAMLDLLEVAYGLADEDEVFRRYSIRPSRPHRAAIGTVEPRPVSWPFPKSALAYPPLHSMHLHRAPN